MSALAESARALQRNNYRLALELAERALAQAGNDIDRSRAAEVAGRALQGLGDNHAALARLDLALELAPERRDLLPVAAHIAFSAAAMRRAQGYAERLLAEAPEHPVALRIIGDVRRELGQPELALEYYRRSLAAAPADPEALTQRLFCLHCSERASPQEMLQAHLDWARTLAPAHRPLAAQPLPPTGRKLRLGYYSPDFNTMATVRLFHPILRHHDTTKFELFIYSRNGIMRQFADLFRQQGCHFVNLSGCSPEQAARAIHRDHLDLLVDLAGHALNNILPALAFKPAPVQVCMLDYWDTTGVAAVDYFITDQLHSPPHSPQLFVEKLLRLPHCRLCSEVPADLPEVAPVPGYRRDYITFGSFNRPRKLTDEVVRVWSAILHGCSGSRLLLQSQYLDNPDFAALLHARFAAHGIEPQRIQLRGRTGYQELLRAYAEVDIALDPFPWNGGLTTLDALLMGVPVVALRGERIISRQSAAILTCLGLEQFIAEDKSQYVAIACRHAADLEALSAWRGELRERFRQSPLADCANYTRDLENLYLTILVTPPDRD